jgi:ribonuclease Y
LDYLIVLSVLIALLVGVLGGFLLKKVLFAAKLEAEKKKAENDVADAMKEAERIKKGADLQVKDRLYQSKVEFEKTTKERRRELQGLEKRLLHREENLDKKTELAEKREMDYLKKEKSLVNVENELLNKKREHERLIEEERRQLEGIAGISAEEAKGLLVESMSDEAKHDAAIMIKRIEDEAKESADKKVKGVMSLAIQRYAGDYVSERTVSIVTLPNDGMKGRIIGREGRNIRAIEAATGIDIIIDDTPEAVILSSMNPVRREVAKIALDRLIADGRIHPARIEEIVNKVEQEVNTATKEAGEKAAFDVGIHGVHPEILKCVGKLRFRYSYAQNVYSHSLEVSFLCGVMAAELGLNEKHAKRAGLLHDIGKAVDHEVEGPHATIGADIARRHGEAPNIVMAIGSHHDDDPGNILGVLAQAADAMSAARPGARREMLETYMKRLEDLEQIATSFSGVDKSYAIQAGRELRVIVESGKMNDDSALMLSKDISKKIEKEMTYPGQIKVTVIRETRAVGYAR